MVLRHPEELVTSTSPKEWLLPIMPGLWCSMGSQDVQAQPHCSFLAVLPCQECKESKASCRIDQSSLKIKYRLEVKRRSLAPLRALLQPSSSFAGKFHVGMMRKEDVYPRSPIYPCELWERVKAQLKHTTTHKETSQKIHRTFQRRKKPIKSS